MERKRKPGARGGAGAHDDDDDAGLERRAKLWVIKLINLHAIVPG